MSGRERKVPFKTIVSIVILRVDNDMVQIPCSPKANVVVPYYVCVREIRIERSLVSSLFLLLCIAFCCYYYVISEWVNTNANFLEPTQLLVSSDIFVVSKVDRVTKK